MKKNNNKSTLSKFLEICKCFFEEADYINDILNRFVGCFENEENFIDEGERLAIVRAIQREHFEANHEKFPDDELLDEKTAYMIFKTRNLVVIEYIVEKPISQPIDALWEASQKISERLGRRIVLTKDEDCVLMAFDYDLIAKQ